MKEKTPLLENAGSAPINDGSQTTTLVLTGGAVPREILRELKKLKARVSKLRRWVALLAFVSLLLEGGGSVMMWWSSSLRQTPNSTVLSCSGMCPSVEQKECSPSNATLGQQCTVYLNSSVCCDCDYIDDSNSGKPQVCVCLQYTTYVGCVWVAHPHPLAGKYQAAAALSLVAIIIGVPFFIYTWIMAAILFDECTTLKAFLRAHHLEGV